jgi:hypothetical protein
MNSEDRFLSLPAIHQLSFSCYTRSMVPRPPCPINLCSTRATTCAEPNLNGKQPYPNRLNRASGMVVVQAQKRLKRLMESATTSRWLPSRRSWAAMYVQPREVEMTLTPIRRLGGVFDNRNRNDVEVVSMIEVDGSWLDNGYWMGEEVGLRQCSLDVLWSLTILRLFPSLDAFAS